MGRPRCSAYPGRWRAGRELHPRLTPRKGQRDPQRGDRINEKEDKLYAPDNRSDVLPENLRNPKPGIEIIQKLIDRLDEREELKEERAEKIRKREQESGQKKRGWKLKPPDHLEIPDDTNMIATHPESQTMKTPDRWIKGYNRQPCSTQSAK